MAGGSGSKGKGKGKTKKNTKQGKRDRNDSNWTSAKSVLGTIATDSDAKTNDQGGANPTDSDPKTNVQGADHHATAMPPSSSSEPTSESPFPVGSSMELAEEQKDEVLPAQIEGKEPERVEGIDPATMPESNNPGNACPMNGGEGDSRGKAIATEEEGERDGPELPAKRNWVEASHPGAKAEENIREWKTAGKEGVRQGLTGDGGRGRGNGGRQYGWTRGRGRGQDEGRAGGRGGRDQATYGRATSYGHADRTYVHRGSDRSGDLGRRLVKILRHEADTLELNIRSDGYVPVKDLLELKVKTMSGYPLCSYTVDDVKEAVKNDNKERFGLVEENGELLIRANQGHSVQAIESEELLQRISSAENIPVCVHGTYSKFLDSIRSTGLKRMSRRHVHFARGLSKDGGVISGMRGNCDTLIYLDVGKALEDGMKIYLSQNGVILTEGFEGIVPSKYFAKIERWPSRELIDFQGK